MPNKRKIKTKIRANTSAIFFQYSIIFYTSLPPFCSQRKFQEQERMHKSPLQPQKKEVPKKRKSGSTSTSLKIIKKNYKNFMKRNKTQSYETKRNRTTKTKTKKNIKRK